MSAINFYRFVTMNWNKTGGKHLTLLFIQSLRNCYFTGEQHVPPDISADSWRRDFKYKCEAGCLIPAVTLMFLRNGNASSEVMTGIFFWWSFWLFSGFSCLILSTLICDTHGKASIREKKTTVAYCINKTTSALVSLWCWRGCWRIFLIALVFVLPVRLCCDRIFLRWQTKVAQ